MPLDETRPAYAALVAASLSWGVSTATSKLALDDVTAFDLLLVEITVATAALWCLRPARSHALVELIRCESHTCYLGQRGDLHAWGHGCGGCPACELRAQGWEQWTAQRSLNGA